MQRLALSCSTLFLFLFLSWLAGCASIPGPGYIVERQAIRVSFSSAPAPKIAISAEYRLRNTGNQPLDFLDVRLPAGRYLPEASEATWDANGLPASVSPDNSRDTRLRFPQSWNIGERHTLIISYAMSSTLAAESTLGFTADAFFLPAGGWTPQLPQPRGFLGFGGAPPKRWDLVVRVPQDFRVHASGVGKNSSRSAETEFRFAQTARDSSPFVVAGRYYEAQQGSAANPRTRIWTLDSAAGPALRRAAESVARAARTYDTLFGSRGAPQESLWIIECPAHSGCISRREIGYAVLLDGATAPKRWAELVSPDTAMVEPDAPAAALDASIGPALAAAWLGYGRNPGFYEQQPPMSALPAFAAARAREEALGPQERKGIVERALAAVPSPAMAESNQDPGVVRAKSLLLFYALRDRVGQDAFRNALQHMLAARKGRGFDVTDLISALEQETHQPIGPFVRLWIKQPGIPDDVRRRYAQSNSLQDLFAQEATQ